MFTSVAAEPDGIAAMQAALEAYCTSNNLHHQIDRDAVARRIIGLYADGNQTKTALLLALEAGDRQSTAA